MADGYPWYEVVEGPELEQGNLLMGCPVILPAPELSLPMPAKSVPLVVDTFDVVVMTQSCDLANDKVREVILCPHWDIREIGKIDDSLAKKDVPSQILKGYRPRYIMLEASDGPGVQMGVRIVDFGRIFSLPQRLCISGCGKTRETLAPAPAVS